MINFLAPILRDQFNKFYRYGYTNIPVSQIIIFDGVINDELKEQVIVLFNSLSPFEYDDDYVILHMDKDKKDDSNNMFFEIQNIISIYPLSKQAKISIESKIDQRIKLEQPIFENILSDIEAIIYKREIEKAIDALWLICNLKGSKTELVQVIGIENIYQGIEFRKAGMKASKIKEGNYWNYLLAYDRFDYFPNSILGYFYDSGQIFAYSKNLPTFEGSGLHKFLSKIDSDGLDIKFKEVIELLEHEESVRGFVTQTTDIKIKQYIVTPLYLMLKDELRKKEDISQTILLKNIEYLKVFGEDFKASIILLGAFFGYKKFYDSYYDKLELRFFRLHTPEIIPMKVEKEKLKVDEVIYDRESETIREPISLISEPITEHINEEKEIVEILAGKGEKRFEEVILNTKPDTILKRNEPIVEPIKRKDMALEIVGDKEDLTANFHKTIISILKEFVELKFSDFLVEFNKQANRKFIQKNLVSIIKEMDEVEKIYRGTKIEKVKLKTNNKQDKATQLNMLL